LILVPVKKQLPSFVGEGKCCLIPSNSIYPPLRLINSAIDDGKLFFYNYLAKPCQKLHIARYNVKRLDMYNICKNDNVIIKLIFAASGERQTYLDLLEIPGKWSDTWRSGSGIDECFETNWSRKLEAVRKEVMAISLVARSI